jgi:hypothetical protein
MVILEPIVAEALAALNAIEFNHDLVLQRICLKGDVLQTMNIVKVNGQN